GNDSRPARLLDCSPHVRARDCLHRGLASCISSPACEPLSDGILRKHIPNSDSGRGVLCPAVPNKRKLFAILAYRTFLWPRLSDAPRSLRIHFPHRSHPSCIRRSDEAARGATGHVEMLPALGSLFVACDSIHRVAVT